jgi:catechol 2,3-dioxygenase-like lactoylglutathione lyase family enzyme
MATKVEPHVANENLTQVVPFLGITDMERSIRFYIDGLGFALKHQWVVDGKLRWCWLTRGAASLMLQEFVKEGHGRRRPEGKLGQGLSLNFQCDDAVALYDEFRSRGLEPSEPFVGNSMWVTWLLDLDGYRLEFHSPTDVPEETRLSEVGLG